MQLPLTISGCPHLSQAFVKSQITRPHLRDCVVQSCLVSRNKVYGDVLLLPHTVKPSDFR